MFAVGAKKLLAGQEIVIYDVENITLHVALERGKDDGFCAIVNIRQRKLIRASHMEEEAAHIDADASR